MAHGMMLLHFNAIVLQLVGYADFGAVKEDEDEELDNDDDRPIVSIR